MLLWKKITIGLFLLGVSVGFSAPARAVDLPVGGKDNTIILINPIGGTAENPKGKTSLTELVGSIIQAAMGILGSVALLVFVYGGFEWITAAGNSDKVESGKSAMTWAVIGICIIFSSYAIIKLVFSTLTTAGADSQTVTTQPGQIWCKENTQCVAKDPKDCAADKFDTLGECQNAVAAPAK